MKPRHRLVSAARRLWADRDDDNERHTAHCARDEFILAATAQNLRKMAKLIPMGR